MEFKMTNKDVNTPDSFYGRIALNNSDKLSGVYELQHETTGNFYIGSSKNIAHRQSTHIVMLRAGNHSNKALQKLYDEDPNFIFNVKQVDGDIKQEEQELLDKYDGHPQCLNIAKDSKASYRGLTHTEATKKVMSLKATGRPVSPKSLEKLAEYNKNRGPITADVRQKMSDGHKTPEAQAKMRERDLKKMKPISIDGVLYESGHEAARRLGLTQGCVSWRVDSNSHQFSTWLRL